MKRLALLPIAVIIVSFLLSSCAGNIKPYVHNVHEKQYKPHNLPTIVAILPFKNETKTKDIGRELRHLFYNQFSGKSYRDIKIKTVDKGLFELSKKDGKPIDKLTAGQICSKLGCDGIIYGKVIRYGKIFAGIYSQIGGQLEVKFIDTKNNRVISKVKQSVYYRSGSIPLSPFGMLAAIVNAALNVRTIQKRRVLNELAWKISDKIPSPKGIVRAAPIKIMGVITNSSKSPFGVGKLIKVGVHADKNLEGVFSIGKSISGIVLTENAKNKGVYYGQYLVVGGDNIKNQFITIDMRSIDGAQAHWVDSGHRIDIDTKAPACPTAIIAKASGKGVNIKWNSSISRDVIKYAVYRSDNPLAGFVKIAKTEKTHYFDSSPEPAKTYYYRIKSVDKTDNQSARSKDAAVTTPLANVVTLTDSFKSDKYFPPGKYILNGNINLPKGITIRFSNTDIAASKQSAINIYGALLLSNVKINGKSWRGIDVMRGGSLKLKNVKLSGAVNCLDIQKGSMNAENAFVSNCDTGIKINGQSNVSINNSHIFKNRIGISLINAAGSVRNSYINSNKTGIQAEQSITALSGNNIINNGININVIKGELPIDNNFFGSVVYEDMKLKGLVSAAKVFDSPAPGGKIVAIKSRNLKKISAEAVMRMYKLTTKKADRYFKEGNLGKAIRYYKNALKLKDDPQLFYKLALSYTESGEKDAALALLSSAVEKFPEDPTLLKSYALLNYQMGKDIEALKYIKKALKYYPSNEQLRFLESYLAKRK